MSVRLLMGGGDPVPDQFTASDLTDVSLSTVYTTTVSFTGFDTATLWSVSGTGDAKTTSGVYTTSGTLLPGESITLRMTSSASYYTTQSLTLTVGGVSDTWTVRTLPDLNPDAFSITGTTSGTINTQYTSGTVTVTGLQPSYSSITVSATNGTVDAGTSALSGTFASSKSVTTSASGSIVIAARGTSGTYYPSTVTVTITIGNQSANYTITTRNPDTTPDAFSFTTSSGLELNTLTTSGQITVTGLEPSHSTVEVQAVSGVSVDAGPTSLSGTFAAYKYVTTSASGSIVVAARATSPATYGSTYTMTVQVGNATYGYAQSTWQLQTRSADTSPNAFSFTNITNASLNTQYQSNTITVSGLEPNYPISITSGGGSASWSIDAGTSSLSGTWATSKSVTSSASGTIVVAARLYSLNAYQQSSYVFVYVGSGSTQWIITTRAADTTPDAFSFTDVTDASINTVYQSNTLTITGLDPNYSINVSVSNDAAATIDAGTSSLSGTWATSKTVTTSASGTLVVAVKTTSPSTYASYKSPLVTVGTGSDYWNITTPVQYQPNAFSVPDKTGQARSTSIQSATVSLSGMTPNLVAEALGSNNSNFGVTNPATTASMDSGTSTLSGTWVTATGGGAGTYGAGIKSVTISASGTAVIAGRVTSGSTAGSIRTIILAFGKPGGPYTGDFYSVTSV